MLEQNTSVITPGTMKPGGYRLQLGEELNQFSVVILTVKAGRRRGPGDHEIGLGGFKITSDEEMFQTSKDRMFSNSPPLTSQPETHSSGDSGRKACGEKPEERRSSTRGTSVCSNFMVAKNSTSPKPGRYHTLFANSGKCTLTEYGPSADKPDSDKSQIPLRETPLLCRFYAGECAPGPFTL